MNIQFINADVAAAYEPVADFDVEIHTQGYDGNLSGLTMVGAINMIATKSQYIRIKETVEAAPKIVAPVVEAVAETVTAPVVETTPKPIVEHPAEEPAATEDVHEQ